ncbi:hypothetical protein [Thiolapillus sp.]
MMQVKRDALAERNQVSLKKHALTVNHQKKCYKVSKESFEGKGNGNGNGNGNGKQKTH